MFRFPSILLGWILILSLAQASNAQPSFTNLGDVLSYLNEGIQTYPNWATITSGTAPFSYTTSVNSTTGTLTFSTAPEVASNGTLTYTVTPGTFGTAVIFTTLNDAITSSIPATFNINVVTNTAPQFNIPAPDIVIDEKAGAQQIINFATSIAAGSNPEENGQILTFMLEPVLPLDPFMTFVTEPTIDKFGALTYEATEFATGTANYLVYLEDDGSADSPNVNKSSGVPMSITINPINDPPSFTIGDNIHIDEHSGLVTISEWATNLSAGGPDESGQALSFVITQTSITPFLQFITPVTVDPAGTLTLEIIPHYHGNAVYEIYITDQDLTSDVQAFAVNVDYINDAPVFMVGPDLVEDEGDVVYTYPNWATNISPGFSLDEQDQQLLFTVNLKQTNGTIAFFQAPAVDATGQLVMRPTEHTHGEAIFDIILSDDGDFEPPHKNFGDTQTFTVTINKVNFPPDDIRLSHDEILDKEPPETVIGFLTAGDLDPEDVHSFALVAGEGSDDNASFIIQQDQLLSAETFNWDVKRNYKIRIKASDGEFSLEKTFDIRVLKMIEGIKFANAITPNDDGENDIWEIEDIETFPDVTIFIYDKAGQPVYSSQGGYIPWDGTYNGKPLPMGTYYYVINLHDGTPIYQGSITILL